MNNSIICVGPSEYDSTQAPQLDGDGACPYCHLAPCVMRQLPSWLRGSAAAALSNMTKRFKLYQKFWTLLRQLGVWSHPDYLVLKQTKTNLSDPREVMPDCVLAVSRPIKS